jgi:CubicO group peptidase (beta-lactamase class C family)
MKQFFKRAGIIILVMLLAFLAYVLISGKTYIFRAVYHNFADIDDYTFFDNNTVATGNSLQPWSNALDYNKRLIIPDTLSAKLESLNTIALLLIRKDSVVLEQYWQNYSDTSKSGSFSMAKSITSLLIGIALKEGKIKSLDEPVSNYLPDFKGGRKDKVTIRHLLTMSSGSDWDEAYINPFSITTEAYYGDDLYKTALKVTISHEPGTLQRYKSGDTQLLGLVLEKATGQSLSTYASEKLWQPIGAAYPALWSTDRENGHVKAYCCFNSNARDFARLGKLMLQGGKWNGISIIDSAYCQQSITPNGILDDNGDPCNFYGYQWWIVPNHPDVFYARGILGQYIICFPSQEVILVRLGKMTSTVRHRGVPLEVEMMVNWVLADCR